jgi:hypothetical protein
MNNSGITVYIHYAPKLLPHFLLKHQHVYPDQKGVMQYKPVVQIPVWLAMRSFTVNLEVFDHVLPSSLKGLA